MIRQKGILADHRKTKDFGVENKRGCGEALFDHQLASRRKKMSGDSSWQFSCAH
jgi:hypothetical protein